MEPIINPWLFYLIDVVDNMLVFLITITGLSGTAVLVFTVAYGVCSVDNYYEEYKPIHSKFLKKSLKIFIPTLILLMLIPNSTTIYKMIIADNITPHIIEIVGDTVESSIDYIFEKINSLTLEEEVKE